MTTSKVKIEVSHHTISQDAEWKNAKPLVFVADEVQVPRKPVAKEEKVPKKTKKPKKTPGITTKNFGSHLQIAKVKNSQILALAWRCRRLCCRKNAELTSWRCRIDIVYSKRSEMEGFLISGWIPPMTRESKSLPQ